jgi:hypothetical protein
LREKNYQVKLSMGFTVFGKLIGCGISVELEKLVDISARDRQGYYVLKQRKPRFDERHSK